MEEAYFQRLERKEMLEERLKDVKELKVRVVQCKEVNTSIPHSKFALLLICWLFFFVTQCNYVAEKESDLCRREEHVLTRLRAVKRCFQCRTCKDRCFTYNQRFPIQSCRFARVRVYLLADVLFMSFKHSNHNSCGERKYFQTSLYKVCVFT